MIVAWTKTIVVHMSHSHVCHDVNFFDAKGEKLFIKMTFESSMILE
jgi:hypothetical protein